MKPFLHYYYLKFRFWLVGQKAPASIGKYELLKNHRKCFVFLAANYGNLGDVAITLAQEQYLRERFSDYEVVDVPINSTMSHLQAIKNVCSPDDVITIVGGGNISDLYFDIELLRIAVIKAFPYNRIISFPQSAIFSDTIFGRWFKKRVARAYSRHKHLTVLAREKRSMELMKSMFHAHSVDVCLTPDIVMWLDKRLPETIRNGVICCLRSDSESNLSAYFKSQMRSLLGQEYPVTDYDTHIGNVDLNLEQRIIELNKILSHFRSTKWVVTDRLHGMIFAYITGTPAIVFNNNNHKIAASYEWIRDCGYIHMVDADEPMQVIELMKTISSNVNFTNVHKRLKRLLDENIII